jgi:hypothetical protein
MKESRASAQTNINQGLTAENTENAESTPIKANALSQQDWFCSAFSATSAVKKLLF